MRVLKIVIVVLLVAAGAVFLFPWKTYLLEKQIILMLAEKGFENPSLTVDGVSTARMDIRDFSAGQDNWLSAQELKISYDPESVLAGRLGHVGISGLSVTVRQGDDGWSLDGFRPAAPVDAGAQFILPMTPEGLRSLLPFDTLDISGGHATVSGAGWRAAIPFTAQWDKVLVFTAQEANVDVEKQRFVIHDLKADLGLHDQAWQGTWLIKSPEVGEMGGAIRVNEQEAVVTGEIKVAGKYGAVGSFSLLYRLQEKKAVLHLAKISMPWSGGTLSVKNTDIPLDKGKAITIPVQFSNVSVENLMRMMTGEYVTGTGTISGVLPVVVMPDGNVSVGNGTLKADHDGKLSVPPEVIPGEGEQIAMTREIMKDFRYKSLNLNVQAQPDGSLAVLVAVEGNNPDLYNGRMVNLNVRLGGDVLDFVRSNVMMLLQPESLLKQEQK